MSVERICCSTCSARVSDCVIVLSLAVRKVRIEEAYENYLSDGCTYNA